MISSDVGLKSSQQCVVARNKANRVQGMIRTKSYKEQWMMVNLLPRDAMHQRGLCRHAVSVCLSVCLSRSWIMSERIKISSKFFHRRVATPFQFSTPNGITIFPRGTPYLALVPAVSAATYQVLSTGSPVDDSHRSASYGTSLVASGGIDCGRRRRNVYDKKPQRYAKNNRTAHLTARSDKSVAYVTIKDSTRRFVLLKLTLDRHEASRGLFATAELLVTISHLSEPDVLNVGLNEDRQLHTVCNRKIATYLQMSAMGRLCRNSLRSSRRAVK